MRVGEHSLGESLTGFVVEGKFKIVMVGIKSGGNGFIDV